MPMVDDLRWQAVVERRSDDGFVYAVRTTGIYCRPACPSRRPRRENVAFFATPADAAAAGFRPCLRCRPDAPAAAAQVVAQVRELLETGQVPPTLADLGAAVGMSPTHLQRVFKRATGLSPKAYDAHLRAERLKVSLQQGTSVTSAQYEAGYGSSRGLYETAGEHLGMTPGRYRRGGAGERIAWACGETALGTVLVAATERGVCALRFGATCEQLVAELRAEFPHAALVADAMRIDPFLKAAAAAVRGEPLELPLDLRGTAFQQKVWAALQQIPRGQVRSYSEVAEAIGAPAAVRAVARACATNPVALAVPCHRVVRKGGDLSGYRWGVERKRDLLARELHDL